MRLWVWGADFLFDPFFKLTPGEHDPTPTLQTPDTDIRAHPVYLPLIAPTRMSFAHLHHIPDLNFKSHWLHLPLLRL